jgi:hypothetical protein
MNNPSDCKFKFGEIMLFITFCHCSILHHNVWTILYFCAHCEFRRVLEHLSLILSWGLTLARVLAKPTIPSSSPTAKPPVYSSPLPTHPCQFHCFLQVSSFKFSYSLLLLACPPSLQFCSKPLLSSCRTVWQTPSPTPHPQAEYAF